MVCPLCEKRKAKRYCPAKGTKICSICCGTEREVTIDCPFECPYLRDSREHDYKDGLDPKDFPYKEIRVNQSFLRENGELLDTCGRELLESALGIRGAADQDARQALEALIQTYKTLEDSGLHYEARPDSAFARSIAEELQKAIRDFQQEQTQRFGFGKTRDGDILRMLVFLYRMALDRDNGRPKGKAFLDFLRLHFRPQEESKEDLIVPGV